VNALDVLRAMSKEPESVEAFLAEVEQARDANGAFTKALSDLKQELADPADVEARARRTVERMAILLQASLLIRHGDQAVADAFCASRLGDGGHQFGTLRPNAKLSAIVARHLPSDQ
jgi:putative acyl-CoA dehydrogenase